MMYLTGVKRSSGFIFVLSIAVVMVIGFSAGAAQAKPFQAPTFGEADFSQSTNIDNRFLTLKPGTVFCYEAETEDGIEENEVTVVTVPNDDGSACTLEIAGVTVIVVRDAVRLEGELTEDTFDFYAQDGAGNVWYLGEASAECEEGEVASTEGSWNADQEGAEAGIVMLDAPMHGNAYQQEFLKDVAEDMAKVQRLNAKVSELCDKKCLETKEWTPLERGAIEFKYYARDITDSIGGLVLTEELKGGPTVRSELVDVLTEVAETGDCPTGFEQALNELLCVSPPPINCPDGN